MNKELTRHNQVIKKPLKGPHAHPRGTGYYLTYMRLSDSEHKTVQAEPGNQEATQGAVESPMKRLLNQRYGSCGDNLQEAGRSKRSWNKGKSTHES